MIRVRTVIGVTVVLTAGATAFWALLWSPFERAREVAEVMSGREQATVVTGRSREAIAHRVLLTARGVDVGAFVINRSLWATRELGRLAARHPGALARAAMIEPSAEVRFAFLDQIDDRSAYRRLPAAMRLEHAAAHAVIRLD